MPTSTRKRHNPLLFLDASILVAATLSPSGGSFRLFQESSSKNLHLTTNLYAYDESVQALELKYPEHLTRFDAIVSEPRITIITDPPSANIARYLDIITPEDAPILAGAILAKTQFLITLDRKHFMAKPIGKTNLPIVIATPQDFFQKYWVS